MADIEQLKRGLVNAHKAGNLVAAKTFANAIKQEMAKNAPPVAREPNATDGMSTTEKVLAGVGMSMVDAKNGLGQMVGLVDQKDIDAAKENNKDLANSGAGTAGNIIGNIAMLAPTSFIPGANSVRGASLINALAGAAITPGSAGDRGIAAFYGGAGGGGGIAAGKLLSGTLKAAAAAAAPLTKGGQNKIIADVMRRAAGENVDSVIARMNAAKELIPGSVPTAAEVAESGGIASLQRAMSAANPEAYTQRGMQQASARVGAVRGIAQDEKALQEAIKNRGDVAESLYGRAFKSDAMRRDLAASADKSAISNMSGGINQAEPTVAGQISTDLATPGLRELAKRPGFNHAIEQAKTLAANKGIQIGDPLQSLEGLHYIKLALDDIASPKAGASALGKNESAAINGMRKSLANELSTISPLYGNARQVFQDMSKPINQMQVGQELLGKMQGPLADHGALASETGAMYARALNDASGNLVKNSTGGIRQTLENVMSPDQMMTLNNVAQDLARKSNAQNLGRGPGSNTFQNFAMDNIATQSGMPSGVSLLSNLFPGMMGTAGGLAKATGNLIYKGKDEVMRGRMAELLLDPAKAAAVMESAVQPGKIGQVVQGAIGQGGIDKITRAAGVAPSLFGAALALPYGSQ